MSRSIEYNGWCVITGEDFREKFFIKDPTLPKIDNPDFDPSMKEDSANQKTLFQAKDLTGYTAKMDIRQSANRSGAILASLETGLGITIGSPDPTDGSVELFIDNLVTNQDPILSAAGTEAFYDIFLIPALGDNIRLFNGTIRIVESVTNV